MSIKVVKRNINASRTAEEKRQFYENLSDKDTDFLIFYRLEQESEKWRFASQFPPLVLIDIARFAKLHVKIHNPLLQEKNISPLNKKIFMGGKAPKKSAAPVSVLVDRVSKPDPKPDPKPGPKPGPKSNDAAKDYDIGINFAALGYEDNSVVYLWPHRKFDLQGVEFQVPTKMSRSWIMAVPFYSQIPVEELVTVGQYGDTTPDRQLFMQQLLAPLEKSNKLYNVKIHNSETLIRLRTHLVRLMNGYRRQYLVNPVQACAIKFTPQTALKINTPQLKIKNPEIYKRLDALFLSGRFAYSFEVSLYNDLIRAGMETLYHMIRFYGINSGPVKQRIQVVLEHNTRVKDNQNISLKLLESEIKSSMLNLIAVQQFGLLFADIGERKQNVVRALYTKNSSRQDVDAMIWKLWDSDPEVQVETFNKLKIKKVPEAGFAEIEGFPDIVCSHVVEYLSWLKANMSSDDAEIRKQLISKYSEPTPIENYYFCKVCGEALSNTIIYEDIDQGMESQYDYEIEDPIVNMVKSRIRFILSSYVQFRTIRPKKLGADMLQTIIPHIGSMESKLSKNKTITPDVLHAGLRIYAGIYIYIFVIKLVEKYPKEIGFNIKNYRVPVKVDIKFKRYLLQIALNLLLTTQNSDINQFQSSVDDIRSIFIEAYNVLEASAITRDTVSDDNEAIYLSNSSYYHWQWSTLNEHSSKEIAYTDIHRVLGVPLDKLDKNNIFSNLEVVGDDSLESRIYKLEMNNLRLGMWLDPALPSSVVRDSFLQKMEELAAEEKENAEPVQFAFAYYRSAARRRFELLPVDYRKMYSPDGVKYNWDTLVFRGKKTIEVQPKDIYKLLVSGEFSLRRYKLVDYKDSKLNAYLSKVAKKGTDAAIRNSLHERTEFNNFKLYYMMRPPNDPIRKKMPVDADYNTQIRYYRMHKKQYQLDTYADNKLQRIIDPPKTKLETFPEWKFSNQSILKISQLTKINYNILINLGLTEQLDYNAIKNNKINPSVDYIKGEEHNGTRFMRIKNYVEIVIAEYNILKYHASIAKISKDIENILNTNNLFHNEKINTLPDIGAGFYKKIRFYQTKHSLLTMGLYVLNYLFDMLLSLINYKKLGSVTADFVVYMLQKITAKDATFGKYNLMELKEEAISNANEDTDPYDGEEKIRTLDVENDPFGETSHDLLSDEGFDYEFDDNIEGSQDF